MRGVKGTCVVVPGGFMRQTAVPFAKIPRFSAVFAQWVCTLADRHVHRHCCSAISLHWMGDCCSSGRSWAGEMVGRGVLSIGVEAASGAPRDRACC